MPLVSDNFHEKKLKDFNINIKTKYIVGNKILERNTDGSINDDISKGIRCEKQYFVNNHLKTTIKDFDSRVEYTFISKESLEKDYKCPNCGMSGKIKEFIDGCPYCRTYYNVDYTDKDLGAKYHYDRVLRSKTYRMITGIIDLIVSLILSNIFIITTSRTYNGIDIIKVFVYGFILALVLYYVFYLLDAYIVLGPIKAYKDRQNEKQKEFWKNSKLDKKSFFNNFNYEVRKLHYSNHNIIDYDVLDYIEFNERNSKNGHYIDVLTDIRIVYYENGKIVPKYLRERYTFQKQDRGILEIKDGINYIKCPNCGSSIDATKTECNFCHTPINYLQEWVIVRR